MSSLQTFVHFFSFSFDGCDAFHNVHTANGVKHLEEKDEAETRGLTTKMVRLSSLTVNQEGFRGRE